MDRIWCALRLTPPYITRFSYRNPTSRLAHVRSHALNSGAKNLGLGPLWWVTATHCSLKLVQLVEYKRKLLPAQESRNLQTRCSAKHVIHPGSWPEIGQQRPRMRCQSSSCRRYLHERPNPARNRNPSPGKLTMIHCPRKSLKKPPSPCVSVD